MRISRIMNNLYIDDVGRLVATLLTAKTTGIVNLATGQSRSFDAIASLIDSMVPDKIAVVSLPRSRPVSHRHFDTTRLREAVHAFAFTPFEDGLRTTLKAFGALP